MIDPTKKTPKVFFDGDKGILEIEGKSIPENAEAFYNQIIDFLEEYIKNPAQELKATLFFEHINTSSAKMLYKMFKTLKDVTTTILWCYSDEDMLEAGEDYKSIVGSDTLKFEFVDKQ